MLRKPFSPSAAYRLVRDNLGSLRRVYLRGNHIERRGDLGSREETVLLLHGFMQTRAVWEVMEDRLRYDGFGVFSFDLGGLFFRFNSRPVDTLAEAIAEKVESICERYSLDRFHVIGHSKGGLVAREYVQHYGGDRRVKSLITMGTPHHGTPTAAIGVWLMGGGLISRAPLQMLPHSRLVKLLSRDTFPPHIPLASIYSRHDLICPYWCSVLRPKQGETSMKNIQVKNVGHTALTYDPGVHILVRKELENAAELWREREGRPAPERQPRI
jgi:triacylglycerol esterase/lipase EstA (alpha/beta hydrolase family)